MHKELALSPIDFSEETLTTHHDERSNLRQENKSNQIGILEIKSANSWMHAARLKPTPKMLFDELWFEGEICILFSDTNLGKSILAVQIADSISKGSPIEGFGLESYGQEVLYCDFELSDIQFLTRYSDAEKNLYHFNDNFLRTEICQDDLPPEQIKDFETYVLHSLEQIVSTTSIRIIIIDNLTFLSSGTEKAKDALPLMKELKAFKKKYELSLLVLAHTPKRDSSNPLTKNDLQGSKMLINFCDSSFALGESSVDKNFRYLKQIKERNKEKKFDDQNVAIMEITKNQNFLQFQYIENGIEKDHLKEIDKQKLIKEILELKKTSPELSLEQIAKKTGTNKQNVYRVLNKNGISTSRNN